MIKDFLDNILSALGNRPWNVILIVGFYYANIWLQGGILKYSVEQMMEIERTQSDRKHYKVLWRPINFLVILVVGLLFVAVVFVFADLFDLISLYPEFLIAIWITTLFTFVRACSQFSNNLKAEPQSPELD